MTRPLPSICPTSGGYTLWTIADHCSVDLLESSKPERSRNAAAPAGGDG
jgi:hypothetical protein